MSAAVEFFADRPGLAFLALVALEIAAVGCLGLLAIRLSKRDAATRYGIGLSALVSMALCAPITWVLQNTHWSTLSLQRTVVLQPEWSTAPAAAVLPEARQPIPVWVWLWLAGVGAILLKMAVGAFKIRTQRARAQLVERLDGGIPVYATDDAGPAVVGAFRPAVLMPKHLLDSLAEEEVRDVLAHEFAHIAHRHLLVALFQRLLTCVLWPHPFVHLISRTVATAREEVCDNAVLRSAGAARYARVLLRVAECRQGPRQFSASMGLLGPPTQLEERVRGLLDPNRRIDSTMNKRKLLLACLALVLGTTAVAGARIQTHVLIGAAQDSYGLNPPKAVKQKAKKGPSKARKAPGAPRMLPPLPGEGAPFMPPPVAPGQGAPPVPGTPVPGVIPGAPGKDLPGAPVPMTPGKGPHKVPPAPGQAVPPPPPMKRGKGPSVAPALPGQTVPPPMKRGKGPAKVPPVPGQAVPPPMLPSKGLPGEGTPPPSVEQEKGVPILSDLPIIGQLFRKSSQTERGRKVPVLSDIPLVGYTYGDGQEAPIAKPAATDQRPAKEAPKPAKGPALAAPSADGRKAKPLVAPALAAPSADGKAQAKPSVAPALAAPSADGRKASRPAEMPALAAPSADGKKAQAKPALLAPAPAVRRPSKKGPAKAAPQPAIVKPRGSGPAKVIAPKVASPAPAILKPK